MVKMVKKKLASAKSENARVSLKNSKILCKEIKGKKVKRAKAILEGLIAGKHSLNGKYYTKTAKKILELLNSAEANAKTKEMDEERLFVALVKADKGRTFIRPRSKMGRRGERAKMTHLQIILEER